VFPVPGRSKSETAASCEEQPIQNYIYACPVPTFYYKKKNWKPGQLEEAMQDTFSKVEGMSDTILSAGVAGQLEESMRSKWQPRPDTLKELTALRLAREVRQLTEKNSLSENLTEKKNIYPVKAAILLGNVQDEDWQMKMAWELLQPYLPKLNNCVVRYEAQMGTDVREELSSFLDDYYYEYGLVVQTESYGEKTKVLTPVGGRTDNYCLNLDFRRNNLYHSAVKYLDTIVKNSYYE
jgi:hypothetical protein